jgi:glycosyltransferase involved in cell wall biosynthesis
MDVSVIIPTYRREREVVESVRSALEQKNVSLEILVLDDAPEGSARDDVERIRDPRVRYLRNDVPSRGRPALVRNKGIALASGRYLYFLDDDDRVLPGALRAMATALEGSPRAAVAYGRVQPFGDDSASVQQYSEWFDWAARASRRLASSSWLTVGTILFRGTLIINSACMIRRESAIALGGYDATIPLYEDVDFHMRGIRRWGHVFVDHPVLHYRTGAPSLIHNLRGNTAPIEDSYGIIHRKYRETYGEAEYRALQLVSKLLPLPRRCGARG